MKWLTWPERLALAERTVQRAAGSGSAVLATANLDPDRSRHEQEMYALANVGVTGLVLVPPPGMGRDQNQLCEYLAYLSEKSPCPVILYEWPQVDDYFINPEVFGDLAGRGKIAGIKDTTCTMDGILAKLAVADSATVFQANTPYLLESLEQGVGGIMAITSTARADLVVRLWEAFQHGAAETQQLHQQLVYMDALLRLAYPATAKFLVSLQGIAMSTRTRWPNNLTREASKALTVWQQATSAKGDSNG
jgi:4-hydroxy-tetrahydrodipicolinate synthase